MLNYIKSEWYRITRGKEIYGVIAAMSAIIIVMNVILFIFRLNDTSFPYATIRFSLNILTSSLPYLFVAGALVVALLFAEERKNGTLKNNIAYGISRKSIFIGKCIVCTASSVICMTVILVFYIGSAFLLLGGPGEEPLQKMLEGIGAALPSALASVILAAVVLSLCKKEVIAVVWWFVITYAVPTVFFNLGRKVELFKVIADWMPANFLSSEVTANMSSYDCLWNTPFGLMKCMVAGFGGAIIFAAAGIWGFRKKEV